MGRRRKSKKPYVHTEITCPHCKTAIELKIFKEITTPSVPADFEYRQELQLLMAPTGAGKDKGETKKPEKKKPTKAKK